MTRIQQSRILIAVIIALAAPSFTSAAGMDVGVWKPTRLLGPISSVAAVEVGPQGDLWAIREYPEGVWSLIRSADGGTSWTTVTAEIATPPQYDPPKLLVVDAQNCAWLYTPGWVLSRFAPDGDLLTTISALSACMVATRDGYVYRIASGLQRINMDGEIRITQPDLGDAIYVLSVDWKGSLYAVGTYVFRSTDGGLTWETIYKGDHETRFDGIAVAPGGNLFIWTFWLLYRSTDGGKTWTELPLLSEQRLGAICSLPDGSVGASYAHNPADEVGRLYGFFRSWDKGNTWEELMAGIPKADYLGCEHVVTYGERIVYAYFRFVEGSSAPSGLYRLILPQRAAVGKDWPKY
jgi:hypothetical protein